MSFMSRVAGAVAVAFAASAAVAADLPVLKAATLETGTVNWELDTIRNNGFDEANGFKMELLPLADNGATRVAFAGGEADLVVADWIWVAWQRAEGKDYVFIPYSKAVGGLLVKNDSPAKSLEDLKGKKIGIAGGPLDKSWLLLRAYAEDKYGFDLAAETEQVFGAPPLIFKTALQGETDGAINFWHFGAKMEAAGMHNLVTTSEAAQALGLDPETPLLGYVLKGELAREHPELVAGLYRASRAAKNLLATDDAAWEAIRPQMNAADDAQFEALKAGFIAGIPADAPVDEAAADKLLQIMAKLGGPELVGGATTLPAGLFAPVTN